MAPAQVLQGAVRLQVMTLSPTPATQVLLAWPWPREVNECVKIAFRLDLLVYRKLFMLTLLFFSVEVGDGHLLNTDSAGSLVCRVFPWLPKTSSSKTHDECAITVKNRESTTAVAVDRRIVGNCPGGALATSD